MSYFSFLSDDVYTFDIDPKHSLKGHIKRLNKHLAKVYFSYKELNGNTLIETINEIQVKDMTLGGPAAMIPLTHEYILSWTSDYYIVYKNNIVLELRPRREYRCMLYAISC